MIIPEWCNPSSITLVWPEHLLTPVPLYPAEDDYDEFFLQLFLFPSYEIRKLWNLFRTENL
jgi:hypothetical protein